MRIDPTGMEDGPGDEFKTLEDAAIDFGKEYNGKSIKEATEYSSNFYEVKKKNGDSYFTYGEASVGGGGIVNMPDEEVKDGYTLVANGHTHGEEDNLDAWEHKGKIQEFTNTNNFSDQDISVYNNAVDKIGGGTQPNKFNKKIKGFVATPNGSLLYYDPDQTYKDVEIKGIFGLTPSYNIPIYTELPSDPNSKSLRKNKIDP